MKLVWHYTVGAKLPVIFASGALEPAGELLLPNEKPILWFSANQFWEQTANKMILQFGKTSRLTMEQTAQYGLGLCRFGIPAQQLTPWPAIGKAANMNTRMRGALMKVGRQEGANPAEWYGTLVSIPLSELKMQTLQGAEWVDYEGSPAPKELQQLN